MFDDKNESLSLSLALSPLSLSPSRSCLWTSSARADDTPETCIYSNWSPWSACSSATCEKGKRMRQRMLKAQLDLSVPCPHTQDFEPCMGPGCSDEGEGPGLTWEMSIMFMSCNDITSSMQIFSVTMSMIIITVAVDGWIALGVNRFFIWSSYTC